MPNIDCNCLIPSTNVLTLLGSAIRHIEKYLETRCNNDLVAYESCINHSDIKNWMTEMDSIELLPVRPILINGYTTEDYRNAPSGLGPLSYTWTDKPHRLIYDLIKYIESVSNNLDTDS